MTMVSLYGRHARQKAGGRDGPCLLSVYCLTCRRTAVLNVASLVKRLGPAKGIIQYSDHVGGNGAAFFEAVEKMSLEGMVSKRRESPYRSGKVDAWVKCKCWDVGDFELLGIKRDPGKPAAARDGRYAGTAFIKLPSGLRERLWKRVQEAKAARPAQRVPSAFADDVEWCGLASPAG